MRTGGGGVKTADFMRTSFMDDPLYASYSTTSATHFLLLLFVVVPLTLFPRERGFTATAVLLVGIIP